MVRPYSFDYEIDEDGLKASRQVDLIAKVRFRNQDAFFLNPRREPGDRPIQLSRADVSLLRPVA
jgi:hypothetical protein